MAISGRVRQTLQVIAAWGRSVPDAEARPYLTDAEFALYLGMSRAERMHHLRVMRALRNAGHTHPALMKAALLHDVGKSRYPFLLPHKVLVVLVKAFAPGRFKVWGGGEPHGWKRPFVISAQHPAWSAEMAQAIGTDPLAVELMRRHQTSLAGQPKTEADHLLRLLQAADDQS
jgi:hypothetical protein